MSPVTPSAHPTAAITAPTADGRTGDAAAAVAVPITSSTAAATSGTATPSSVAKPPGSTSTTRA